jgi:hypothetical protein
VLWAAVNPFSIPAPSLKRTLGTCAGGRLGDGSLAETRPDDEDASSIPAVRGTEIEGQDSTRSCRWPPVRHRPPVTRKGH